MKKTLRLISKVAAAALSVTLGAGAALAAKAPADPCKFQKTIKQGGTEISIDIPADEPCGLGTFFMTIVPRKGDPQTLKANRDGMLIDAYTVELSGAAPPEIVVLAKGDGAAAYGAITIFESVEGRYVEKQVAPLRGPEAEGYAGRDVFTTKNGVIIRQFPLFAPPAEPGAEPQATGETRTLTYDFAGNRWTTF
ncbi:MAG: hypothetical protein NDJ92_18590 [Thermoanaerobaculia bacterium]|nr:hypothetical protein [Thermoanaerobaculia bacterium]